MREALSYDDVLLVPRRGVLQHRKDADLTTRFSRRHDMMIPIISAPMSSVTEVDMACEMSDLGGLGVIHRNAIDDRRVNWFVKTREQGAACAVAIGIDDVNIISRFIAEGCQNFVLDVAHAHSNEVIKYVEDFKKFFGQILIVGNVATGSAASDLEDAGADGLKVGIGPGAACTTRTVTGFGMPQLTAIMDVASVTSLPIIADGGIKNSGDIVKALAAGADSVMLGRLLAGADESPEPGKYWGMASAKENGHRAPEGIEGDVPLTGPVEDTIKNLTWGIRSGISYAGATNIRELRENAEFVRVSPMSAIETSTRLL